MLFVMSWQFAVAQTTALPCSATDIDTDDDGLIDICYLEDLNEIRNNIRGSGHPSQGCGRGFCFGYELRRDLNFLDDASYRSTSNKVIWTVDDYTDSRDTGWQPIVDGVRPFSGTFEGNNHTISNLMINRPATNDVGLFQDVGPLITVPQPGGGVLIRRSSAKVVNLKLRNINVQGNERVGGVAGSNTGSIENSDVNGIVKGGDSVGGLVGLNVGGVTNSYASGDVEGDYFVGGLLGESLSSGDVSNSHASGRVKGNDSVGGLIGYNDSPIETSYAEGGVEGNENVGGLIGLNDGRISNSYSTGNVLGRLIYAGGLIGGNNNHISNSYATGNVEANRHGGGLIGGSQVGRITNSYATGNVTGNSLVGGLIAVGLGDITDSHAKGDVVGTDFVGGLIAVSFGDITDSYAEGNVTGADFVGGLVGLSEEDDNIINSYAEGDVAGVDYVGGLVGLNFIGGQTINSYAEGDVSGDWNVGGLVGEDRGSIANSYASGNVKGHHVGSFSVGGVRVGGLVGYLVGDITDVYAEGDVTGNSLVGGLVGIAIDSNIINGYAKGRVTGNFSAGGLVAVGSNYTVTNSYWDNTKTASSARGTGFSSAALKSPTAPGSSQSDPYYLWSEENWHFGTAEQYPVLRYTKGSDANNPACGPAADLPDCDALLSGQRVGLATLILTGGPILLPPFSTETRDYRVINSTRLAQIQLIPTAVNPGATITVRGIGGFSTTVVSGMTSSAISLNTSGTTSITVEVAEADGKRVAYTLDVNNSTFNEGERIVLDGKAIYGSDEDSLSYRWTQKSGVSLLAGLATDQAELNIKLRENLIAKTSDTVIVVLSLAVREAGMVIDSKDVTLTIAKVNNGFIRLSAAPTLKGSVLTAPEIDSIDLAKDPDGTGSLVADSYQWQEHVTGSGRGWIDVGSPTKTYEIATNTAMNTKYQVQFSYSDGQGYVRQLVSQVFTYSLDIDVDGDGYIEINDLEDLNAMRYQLDGSGYNLSNSAATKITTGCPAEGCKGYELVRDLDFGDDSSYGLGIANKEDWTRGQGWQPIGTFEEPFNSNFRANGHTISNLYIYRIYAQNDVGLFGATGDKAAIADVRLLDVDVTGRDGVGGLVGYKRGGTVSNSYVTGRVAGEGLYEVGGLVGWQRGGTITDSYTSSTVVATGTDSGGLVGNNDNATIKNSYALGSVMADENSGGLVGRNTGTVTRSYATGAVEGADAVGGLVGYNRGIITNSQATGGVTGAADVGGLVGWSAGDITNSYAIGAVAGGAGVGGFIGNNLRGTITNSYARGNVSGTNQYIGGFAGWNGAGTIINSYARGDVSGQKDVGGLVGVNNELAARVAKSYAVGRVVGKEDAGGLVGENRRGTITKSYWNTTNNPTTTSAGGTAKTSVELQTPTAAGSTTTEIYYDWQSDDWNFATPTRYPILKHAVGPDMANPACGDNDDLPGCDTLLSGQLPPVGLLGLTLSEGATLSPRFSAAVNDYYVNVKADAMFLTVQFTASDADATIKISTDGVFADDDASSNTRISLDGVTLITITVIAEYGTPSKYRLYINRIPEIALIGGTSLTIKAGREETIDVTVSDADINDALTLSLRAIGGSPDIVQLTTTTITVLASDSPVRQSLDIKGLKAGNTMLELTVRDEHVAATVSLPVAVTANSTPTISGLSDIGLLAGTTTTLTVTLGDADDDGDATRLKAYAESDKEAIATASIAETGGATRVLTVNAGSISGRATITVMVDDGREVENSEITKTFGVAVEVNEAPILTIISSPGETITLGSQASLVVSVADANFDVNDSVDLEVISSDSAVSVEPVGIVDIRGDTDKTFVLTGAQAGTAMISITATDSQGASVSKTVSVHVNAKPMIVSFDDPFTVKAGREGSLDVTVSDANLDDSLTLSLWAPPQDIVKLTTPIVTVSGRRSVANVQKSLGIKGLQAGESTILALTVRDEYGASETVLLTVNVVASGIQVQAKVFLEGLLQ